MKTMQHDAAAIVDAWLRWWLVDLQQQQRQSPNPNRAQFIAAIEGRVEATF